jgi:xanthine dehydrogenase molybdopterin-binding subunit B
MIYAKLLRSPVPHALIRSIDTSEALELDGVMAIITGRDLPIPYGILPVSQDEHTLCVDKVRFIGDPVAAVAALDEDIAFEAMNLIRVEYEPLTSVASIEDAIKTSEPRIHDYGDSGNIHKRVTLEFGDMEEGFSEADLISEDLFFYEGNTHLPLEQHCALARFDADEKLTLWSSTQTPHYVHRALAKTLEIPDRHAQRRRLRRQVGSVQSRNRSRETRNANGPTRQDHTHARRSLLLPSRSPSGFDVDKNGRETRRLDDGDALPLVSRRRRVWQLRRRLDFLHGRVANRHL